MDGGNIHLTIRNKGEKIVMKANKKIARFTRAIDVLDQKGEKIAGLIMSHAGLGKTSTLRMYCDCMGYNLYTLIPSSYASDDILGLQTVTKGDKLVRLTPSWFDELSALASNGKRTLLFIDELSTCDAYIQAPLLDLIFSRTLGTNRLPDNVFIISSGNYSEDLNGEFKMSAPMVNRFVILNITSNDVNVAEVVERSFGNLKTREEKLRYLGLDSENGSDYSYSAFQKWVMDKNEISLGRTQTEEVAECGLVGFTSVRSIDFCMKFAECFLSLYNEDDWLDIVGDTLGYSNVRQNILMRTVLQSEKSRFYGGAEEGESLSELCDLAEKEGVTKTLLSKMEVLMKSMSSDDLTDEDREKFQSFAKVHVLDKGVNKIISLYTNLCK